MGGSSNVEKWGNPIIGFKCGLPITFRFGKGRHWDFRIEPFDIFFNSNQFNNNYFGFQFSFGYRY